MERIAVLTKESKAQGIIITTGQMIPFYTHTHAYCELLVYEPFDGHTVVNGSRIDLDRPTVILLPPSDFHSIYAKKEEKATYQKIAFELSELPSHLTEQLTSPLLWQDPPKDSLFSLLLCRLYRHREDPKTKALLLAPLVWELLQNATPFAPHPQTKSSALVLQAEQRLRRDFCQNITLQSMAKELHVSSQYLSASFQKHMGLCFTEYLCRLRLKYAHALLSEGDLQVTEVCYACGYRNLSHFLRSFKAVYGMTPKQWADRSKERNPTHS